LPWLLQLHLLSAGSATVILTGNDFSVPVTGRATAGTWRIWLASWVGHWRNDCESTPTMQQYYSGSTPTMCAIRNSLAVKLL